MRPASRRRIVFLLGMSSLTAGIVMRICVKQLAPWINGLYAAQLNRFEIERWQGIITDFSRMAMLFGILALCIGLAKWASLFEGTRGRKSPMEEPPE